MRRLFLAVIALSATTSIVSAAPPVCAPQAMLRASIASDGPSARLGHFSRVPKVTYRSGTKYGRIEEALNPQDGVHLLIVVSEPDMWIADLRSGRGSHEKDPGPTYNFRARIFGDPEIRSVFINSLEIGCEETWLLAQGAKIIDVEHPALGHVQKLTYQEGSETLLLFLRNGIPLRLEVFQEGSLYAAIRYLEFTRNLPFEKQRFEQPAGINFSAAPGAESGT